MSHSPAPWHVDGEEIFDANGDHVVWELGSDELDARLIAAAPELLEALKVLRNEVLGAIGIGISDSIGYTNTQCLGNRCQQAFEAIRKAEGQS